jgi:hypothetical protein
MTKIKNDIRPVLKKFKILYPGEEVCLELLSRKKWEKGFVCKKCGNTNYCKGKKPFSRRCTKCKSEESATSNTLFHNCRIPLHEALEITLLNCIFPDISSYEISRNLERRHMTCYHFQKKIKSCIEGKEQDKLLKELLSEINKKMA